MILTERRILLKMNEEDNEEFPKLIWAAVAGIMN